MFRSKRLHRNTKLYRRIPVGADKLIMLKLDHIPLCIGNGSRNTHQFTRFVREQHRHREDPVSLDQSVLYDRRHGDHVHIAAA